ncbi:Spore germination protein XA [Paenibacillus konkukensis]|uniref:Spore germination protein XA n=1 Tax=Paenibacillus konkukensis TaxID=2020716 RepID=A0ABY4RF68_9BACL|nr:spore germination protein [Paenibacillus konkukensis]UQZ81216.1 Spore germination protein XA [Paenibacillus konkukensis]
MNDPSPECRLRELFGRCDDVMFDPLNLPNQAQTAKVLLIYCEGMCDVKQMNSFVVPSLLDMYQRSEIAGSEALERHAAMRLERITDRSDTEDIVNRVFRGDLLMLFEPMQELYSVNLADPPSRGTEESNTEVSIKGPRDGFTEERIVNIGLIRKRLKTNRLAVRTYTFGEQTETKVSLLFMQNIIKQETLAEIEQKLGELRIKELTTSTQLEEALAGFSLFPMFVYSGRPDYIVSSLLHGRFVLIIDGSPTASVAPVNLTFILNSSEDSYNFNLFVMFTRCMRMLGLLFSLFLPGFWIALLTFHQDQLPFSLLATLVISRQGVPLPVPLEALVMLLLFELFREAGMRLPSTFGQTLSVVGGLIIGQAAISAGITAPGILVVIALSVLSTFTLTNQSMVGMVSILRMIVLIISGMLGLFGFLVCLMGLVVYLVNQRSFGVYYMEPLAPPSIKSIWAAWVRTPWGKIVNVPTFLKQNGGDKKR